MNSVLYRSHPNWHSVYGLGLVLKGLLGGAMLGAIAVGLGFAGVYSTGIGIAIAVVVVLAALGLAEFIRRSTVYTVTGQTVRIDAGILNRRREEFNVRKVQSIDVQQNLLERFVLRTGSIALDSASPDRIGPAEILFIGIARPHMVADLIRNADYGGAGYRGIAGEQPGFGESPDPYAAPERPPAPVYQPHPGLPPR